MVLSPMDTSGEVTIVDIKAGHEVVDTLSFSDSVRPPALAADHDLFFQHVDGLNGFEVAELNSKEVFARVKHSVPLEGLLFTKKTGWLSRRGFQRCHGLGVRPDEKEVWSTCGHHLNIHSLDEGFDGIASLDMPGKGYWLTFTPDSAYGLIALSDQGQVAMVDAKEKIIVDTFTVGDCPKRNLVIEVEGSASGRQPAP